MLKKCDTLVTQSAIVRPDIYYTVDCSKMKNYNTIDMLHNK